jgi:hypothetical protein
MIAGTAFKSDLIVAVPNILSQREIPLGYFFRLNRAEVFLCVPGL